MTTPWKAMGIALLLAPATVSARHDAYTDMVPGCMQARIFDQTFVDPNIEVFDAHVFNACDTPTIQVRGTAELWVEGELVASSPLDDAGRAHLHHMRGPVWAQMPACVVIRGEQRQTCEHKVTDTPGHQRHGATFPIQVEHCQDSEAAAAVQ